MSQHFFFLSLFLYLLFLKSNGQDVNPFSAYCHEHNCGGVPIRYPFWQIDNTTSVNYCGYQGFGINCSNSSDPIIYISDHPYFIKNITYGHQKTLTLVDFDVTSNRSCPQARKNLTLGTLPLGYSSIDSNLTFYLNCNSSIDHGEPIECLKSGDKVSYMARGVNEYDDLDWFDKCDDKVVATVAANHSNWLSAEYGVVMNQGFVLDWRTGIECRDCEETGGFCGYANLTQEVTCHCNDGLRRKRCRKEEG